MPHRARKNPRFKSGTSYLMRKGSSMFNVQCAIIESNFPYFLNYYQKLHNHMQLFSFKALRCYAKSLNGVVLHYSEQKTHYSYSHLISGSLILIFEKTKLLANARRRCFKIQTGTWIAFGQ